LAISRKLIPPVRPSEETVNEALKKVVDITKYSPKHWENKAHREEVRKEFSGFYQYAIMLWLMEFISIFTTPLVLIFTLPPCAENIVEYLREVSVTVRYSNYRYLICKYSLMDLENDGDESYGSPVSTIQNSFMQKEYMPKHGKLESSIIQFCANYPTWTPKQRGQSQFLSVNNSL